MFLDWRYSAIGLAGLLALLAGGCAGQKVMPLKTAQEFNDTVKQNNQPVLVDFYKGGCPSCVLLDGTMDKLADEYRGRAVVAKFMLMTPVFTITSSELNDRYDIAFYPTAILFVNGQEAKRWVANYNINDYRRALDEAIRNMRQSPASQP